MKDPLFRHIEAHWRAHRPTMVQGLEAKGLLSASVEYAAQRTAEAESSLIQQGVPAPEAQELMRQVWAFLPSEADVPDLPNGSPETWLQKPPTMSSRPMPPSPSAGPKPA